MSDIAIVYWSGTGNTRQMAERVAAATGGTLYEASDFTVDMAGQARAIAFGCPSMGSEILEEEEFQPMFDRVSPALSGKSIALFGSYGWGDGEWMRNWADECRGLGAVLVCEPVICMETPDDAAFAALDQLGEALK